MEYYSSCKVLPLKIFFEIAETENVELLLIDNAKKDKEILIETWENIVKEYAKLDNNYNVQDVFDKNEQIAILAAQYIEINAMLLYLKEVKFRQDYVLRLRELGYKIKEDDYISGIESNMIKVNHIGTKIKFLQNDIEKFKTGNNKSSFDQCLAWISANLNFWPPDDITVARYLELKKQIDERNKSQRFSK